MFDTQQLDQVIGSEVQGSDGKIGKVGQVYLDDQTNQPAWITVNTGLFGSNESFIPVQEASFSGGQVTVPFDKAKVKDAPQVASDGHISPEEEHELYRYYGLGYRGTTEGTYVDTVEGTYAGTREGTVGHDTSGPTTDNAMTLSEEQLRAGKRTEEAGRARLRKYVTTETQTETVPVTKERAVVEREPITDANVDAALEGPEISEEEHELVLHEEVPVVEKAVTPVERVRLDTEQVTEQETVSADVRKEQVEVEGDVSTR